METWIRCDGDAGARTIFASSPEGKGACRIGLKEERLSFEITGGGLFSVTSAGLLTDGKWHHLAVTYDRVPIYRWSNQVRFFIDGNPAGNGSINVADAGAVVCPSAVLGGDGFKGAIAGTAVYPDLLFPLAIRNHALAAAGGDVLAITIAPKGAGQVTVDEPVIRNTVNVPLDPAPEADNGPALRDAVNQAPAGTRVRIVSKADGKGGGSYHVRSLVQGRGWSSIQIEDKTDFELDGNGATLVFADNVATYLRVRKCTRTAVRNLSFDLDPSYAQVAMYAKILEADPATGEIKAQVVHGSDGSPVKELPQRASYWRWRAHDPVTLRLGSGGPGFDAGSYARKPQADPAAGPGVIRFKMKTGPQDKWWKELASYQAGTNFYMINNGDFSTKAVDLFECSHVSFAGVNWYAALGMVFLSSDIDHLRVAGCKIGLPPGMTAADRPLASGADGYHFHLTRGAILFENNEIVLTDDDPVSFKDSLWTGLKRIDARRLEVGEGGFEKGAPVELLGPDFLPAGYKAKVAAVEKNVIVLDKDLPAKLKPGTALVNRSHHTWNWIVRDNYFHDYYGRVMLYTDYGNFTGNRVHNSYYHLGISDAYFERAGVSGHVITHGNLFEGTDVDCSKWGGNPDIPGFHAITFSANSFLGKSLQLGSAESALVAGNWFSCEDPPVSLSNSPNTRVLNNFVANSATGFQVKAAKSPGLIEKDNLPAPASASAKP